MRTVYAPITVSRLTARGGGAAPGGRSPAHTGPPSPGHQLQLVLQVLLQETDLEELPAGGDPAPVEPGEPRHLGPHDVPHLAHAGHSAAQLDMACV